MDISLSPSGQRAENSATPKESPEKCLKFTLEGGGVWGTDLNRRYVSCSDQTYLLSLISQVPNTEGWRRYLGGLCRQPAQKGHVESSVLPDLKQTQLTLHKAVPEKTDVIPSANQSRGT